MAIKGTKTEFVFTRNPIVVQEDFLDIGEFTYTPTGGKMVISMNGNSFYAGQFQTSSDLKAEINIADIVDAKAKFIKEPIKTGDPIIYVEDEADLLDREICVELTYDLAEVAEYCTVFPGGVPRQHYRRYAKQNTDAFAARFCNYNANFLMTTRTNGWRIVIPETELSPIPFILAEMEDTNGADLYITPRITDPVTGKYITCTPITGLAVMALDVEAVRKSFFNTHKILPSILNVEVHGVFAFQIVIQRQEPAIERYRCKFRNSLGVFETISIEAEATVNRGFGNDDEQDGTYYTFDNTIYDLTAARQRVAYSTSIDLNVPMPNGDRREFLFDMLASEDVYLLDITPDPIKVIPTVENFNYLLRQKEPEFLKVSLTLCDSDANVMADLIEATQAEKTGRIFNDKFSEQFN